MQVIAHDGQAELADILAKSAVLDITDHGATRLYTLDFNGNDILIFSAGEQFWSVYPCKVFDAECCGSIHDHARAINAEQGRAPGIGEAQSKDLDG